MKSIIILVFAISLLFGVNFAYAQSTPDAPTNLTAISGNEQITLSWTAPTNSNVTHYIVEYRYNYSSLPIFSINSNSTSIIISDLINGTEYDFKVFAVNDTKKGKASHTISSTPGAPDAPINLVAIPGNGQVILTWIAPDDNGSTITNYHIVYKKDGTFNWILSKHGSDTNALVSGLENDSSYKFKIYAKNDNGNGATTSTVSSTPSSSLPNAPDAPTNLTATSGNGQVKLSWRAPADNGSKILHYTIEYKTNSTWLSLSTLSSATSMTISNLKNGTEHEFRVLAVNGAGTSKPSSTLSITPGTPGVPTHLILKSHNGKIELDWTPPHGNGSPITSYTLLLKEVNSRTWIIDHSDKPITGFFIINLENGKLYEIKLFARNANGTGPVTESVFAKPGPPGQQPTNLSAIPDDGHVTISWNAPKDRGANITYYLAEYRTDSKWSSKSIYSTGSIGILFGLKNDTSYEIRISAGNNAGTGPPSKSIFVTPSAESAPSEPLNVIAKPNNKKVSLTWDIPQKRNPQITHYDVRYDNGNGWKEIPFATSKHRNYTASNLTNGVEYEFQVRAKNIDGNVGPWSASVFATPADAPQPPTNLSSKSNDMKIKLSWDAPIDDGGSKIIDYIIEYNHNNNWQIFDDGTSNKTTSTVTGLTNGTSYEFRVSAKNAVKQGEASDIISAIPATTPSAPTNFKAEPNSKNLILSWDEPKNDGGSPITHYKVYYRTHSTWSTPAYVTTSDTFITITDLNSGFYIVTVQAVNDIGGGKMSKSISKQIN